MNTIPLKIAGRSALSAGTLLLTVMLWLVSFDTASAQDILSRRISVSFKDETLRGAVDKISTEAAVKINYSIGASVLEKKVTLNASNESLGSVLKRLLTPLSLTYSFFNNEIIIRQLVEKNDNKAAIGNLQQEMVQISGYVTDSAGAPLPGVTVVEKNGNKGAVTDAKGFYTITVPKGSQMVFRMSGYTSHEAEAGDNQPQRIVLKESVGLLKEVVVLAYGQQQKKDITASVATVKGADLVKSTSANISGSLAGRLPGLRAIQRSGEPGEDGASIDIRGFGTALIVVDGVPVNSFSNIDPNEIESISI
ncbi:MAG TPA: carboxypeptidase-like regulatory domain-containing protein, partial [Chitinophaga sp.]|uniref:carboxypeptidase-like regulatory domain-containing protein n=1 Tax=Chitinophaga sp. TaxID=1869181 RepID=UPI002BCBC41A